MKNNRSFRIRISNNFTQDSVKLINSIKVTKFISKIDEFKRNSNKFRYDLNINKNIFESMKRDYKPSGYKLSESLKNLINPKFKYNFEEYNYKLDIFKDQSSYS